MNRSLEYSSIKPNIPIILASGSESRKQMLEEAGIIFEVVISSTDEDVIKNEIVSLPFSEQVIHLAKAKAESVSKKYPDNIELIGGRSFGILKLKFCITFSMICFGFPFNLIFLFFE